MKAETTYALRVAARRIVCQGCTRKPPITTTFNPDVAKFCEFSCGFFNEIPRIAEAVEVPGQSRSQLAADVEQRCEHAMQKGPAGLQAHGEYAREAFRILEPRSTGARYESRRHAVGDDSDRPRRGSRRTLNA
jgi:hypothetical protein